MNATNTINETYRPAQRDETYNGWTNYATWRVNLEFFDGFNLQDEDEEVQKMSVSDFADYLKDMVIEAVELDCDNTITLGYANAFLDDVNWYEIAEHLQEVEK